MPIKKRVSKETYEDFLKLKEYISGFSKRVYLVGGAVRDIYLKNPVKDIDIEVYDIPQDKFEKIMRDFKAKGVGKKFFVYKWKNFDISLPRIEKKIGIGHKAFEVQISQDEKEASRRRDFTINALMINIFNEKLYDFWGGKSDLEKKLIKIVDFESFKDDSLRVLRAVQFAARFGFKCEKESIDLMKSIDLGDLSKDRIFWEFEKLFNAKYLHIGAYYLYVLDIFQKIFSIKVKCKDIRKICKEFILFQDRFDKRIYRYYFLYIISKVLKKDINIFLSAINAPKIYEKFYKIQPLIEDEISDRDILQTALKMPIKDWIEAYRPKVKKRAKKFGVFDKKLDCFIDIPKILDMGYKGKEIASLIKKEQEKCVELALKGDDL